MSKADEMREALITCCVPQLREMGFRGSFPNFYRVQGAFGALVNFQFNRQGSAFSVNLGYVDPDRENVVTHKRHEKMSKMRVSFTGGHPRERDALSGCWRLGQVPLGDGLYSDSWFSFWDPVQTQSQRDLQPEPAVLAHKCNELMAQEAETWWREKRQMVGALNGAGDTS